MLVGLQFPMADVAQHHRVAPHGLVHMLTHIADSVGQRGVRVRDDSCVMLRKIGLSEEGLVTPHSLRLLQYIVRLR